MLQLTLSAHKKTPPVQTRSVSQSNPKLILSFKSPENLLVKVIPPLLSQKLSTKEQFLF